jgi:DNA-binding NtrC family response regulator
VSPAIDSASAPFVATWNSSPLDDEIDLALQDALTSVYGFVVGYSEAMHSVCRWIRVLAHPVARVLDVRSLIVGETGVGKELVARAVHRLGPRRREPFFALNCAAISSDLAASELFGHVRGAFTTAVSARKGALQEARGGVLFLDEIGDLPLDVQSQLLRVLEQRVFSPVGSGAGRQLQAQVISATHQGLGELVREGRFRADLYFRVAQLTVQVPSLSQRSSDVPLLARHFWSAAGGQAPVDETFVEQASLRPWLGNVRELRSAVERLVLLRRVGEPDAIDQVLTQAPPKPVLEQSSTSLVDLRTGFDKTVLEAVLQRAQGDINVAARELGVTRRTIYNLLRRHRVRVPRRR